MFHRRRVKNGIRFFLGRFISEGWSGVRKIDFHWIIPDPSGPQLVLPLMCHLFKVHSELKVLMSRTRRFCFPPKHIELRYHPMDSDACGDCTYHTTKQFGHPSHGVFPTQWNINEGCTALPQSRKTYQVRTTIFR